MRRCGYGDLCAKPGLNVHIGGLVDGEERVGLVFDANNPCGMELSAAGINVAALRRVHLWQGCVQFTGEPGERVMVTGHVLSHAREVEIGRHTWETINPCAAEVASSQPRIKLAISSCLVPGDVIIDSDSQISMPAGELSIDALIPASGEPGSGSPGIGGWEVLGEIDTQVGGFFSSNQLIVRACPPAQCWCPRGVLSEWLPTDNEVPSERMLVRPRRAVNLEASGVIAAGAPYTPTGFNLTWQHLPNYGAAPVGGRIIVNNRPQLIEHVGAAPWWYVTPQSSGMANLRWGIE